LAVIYFMLKRQLATAYQGVKLSHLQLISTVPTKTIQRYVRYKGILQVFRSSGSDP